MDLRSSCRRKELCAKQLSTKALQRKVPWTRTRRRGVGAVDEGALVQGTAEEGVLAVDEGVWTKQQ
jgi:hypothetical protein